MLAPFSIERASSKSGAVQADRFRLGATEKVRVMEAIELALKRGSGRLNVYKLGELAEPELWRYSTGLHCPQSDLRYADPQPALFSFNSAFGACETCRGFGRIIGVDLGLMIPDPRKTLRNGTVKTIMTPAWAEIHDDLLRYAGEAGIPRDTAWNQLTAAQRDWVLNGSPNWNGKRNKQWYGIHRFFGYLESKAYKMHIRVLLSKYRSYTPGFARRAGPGAWRRLRRTWSTTSSPMCRCASGCCHCPSRCACCWPRSPSW